MTLKRFSTEDLPQKDRVAILQDVYARIERVDLEFADDAPDATAVMRLLPDLTVVEAACSPCISRRTRRHVADGKDDIVLCVVLDGRLARSFDGGEAEVYQPGEAYVGFSDRPSEHHLAGEPSFLDISMPRAMLAPAVTDLDDMSKGRLPVTAELRLLTSYALALTREAGEMTPGTASRCASHVVDLAAMAIGATRDAAQIAKGRGVRVARLNALKADITANLGQADLTIGTVAARHGLSPQYVRALFNGEGTTFAQTVLNERLACARRRLVDPEWSGRSISEIAFGSGFGDLSYFNRTFRRKYGMTPSDARAAAMPPSRQ